MRDLPANAALARRALLGAGVTSLLLAPDASQADLGASPADLTEAVEAYDRATIAGDTTGLASIIADDYVLVNSDASIEDRAQYLADFHLPGFRIEPYVMQEPMHRIWGAFALTGGLLPLSWIQDGARHERRLRIVHAWIKSNGRWRIAYTQLTRVSD